MEHPHAHASIEEESVDDLGLSLKTIETQLKIIVEEVINRRSHMFYFNGDLQRLDRVFTFLSIFTILGSSALGLWQVRHILKYLRSVKVLS